jgi:ATP-binding cassette, subfamily B, bacterial
MPAMTDPYRRRLGVLPRLLQLSWRTAPGTFVLWLLLNAVSGLAAVAQMQLLRQLVETAQLVAAGRAALGSGVAWGGALAALALLSAVVTAGHDIVRVRYQEHLRLAIEERLYRHLQAVPLELLELVETHDRVARVRQGMNERLTSTLGFFWDGVTELVTLLSLLIYLVQFSWLLPLLLLVGTTPAVFTETRHQQRSWLAHINLPPLERRLGLLDGLLTGRSAAAEVRLFGFGDWLIARADRLRRRVGQERLRLAASGSRSAFLANVIRALTYGAAIVLSVALFATGALGVGAAAALFYAIETFQQTYRDLVHGASVVYDDLRYVQDFFDLVAGSQRDPVAGAHPAGPIKESVVFDDVSFTYPGRVEPALEHLSLTVSPGERIALVGENGAGKSTFVKLLLGLYRPTTGRILVDGVDLREIASADWHRRIGAVFQEFARYQTTVRENIGFGWIDKLDDVALVEAAAARSGVSALAAALPHGLDTPLGHEFRDGADLSVGQWQKLAIARAYLRPAELLILDEPASALDAGAEADVYAQFAAMARERTVVMISHRLGSCRIADRILVLEHGRLVEAGTHAALLAAGGAYAALYRMQAAWYAPSRPEPRN